MLNHHVVLVTIKGYHLMDSFFTRHAAISYLIANHRHSGAVIYRDGNTGKRYSHNEAAKLLSN